MFEEPFWRLALLTLLCCSILSGCATTTGSAATDANCLAFAPIYWSIRDSDETIAAVKAHNAVWKGLCEP